MKKIRKFDKPKIELKRKISKSGIKEYTRSWMKWTNFWKETLPPPQSQEIVLKSKKKYNKKLRKNRIFP